MKLAKIGTTTHENQVIHQSDMLRGLWRPNAKLIIYTEEQRQELVRESIYRFIMDYVESYQAVDALGKCVDKLFEVEGL